MQCNTMHCHTMQYNAEPYNTLQYIAKEYNSMPYNAMAGARRRPASPKKSSLYHRCVRWMVMIKTIIIIIGTKITELVCHW